MPEENNTNNTQKPAPKIKLAKWIEKLLVEISRLLVFLFVVFLVLYFFNPKKQEKELKLNYLLQQDELLGEIPMQRPVGIEWPLDEIVVNTIDDIEEHFVKAKIIVYYEPDNPILATALKQRKSEIHAEVRKIIGSKKYLLLKNVKQQEIVTQEIKNRIQYVVATPGIIAIFLKEFIVY